MVLSIKKILCKKHTISSSLFGSLCFFYAFFTTFIGCYWRSVLNSSQIGFKLGKSMANIGFSSHWRINNYE